MFQSLSIGAATLTSNAYVAVLAQTCSFIRCAFPGASISRDPLPPTRRGDRRRSSLPAGRPQLWHLNNEDYEDEAVAVAAHRCVLLKAAYRPLAFAETLEGLALQGHPSLNWGLEALGPVRLEHPEMPLAILEEYDPREESHDQDPPPVPVRYWLVEEVGQKPQGWLKDFVLNQRPYVSTSTLKPDLAFLMAHLARVREGASVIDPDFTAGLFHLTRRTLKPGGRAVLLYPQALVKHLRAFARAAELTLHAAYPCDTTSGRKRRLVILEVPS
eukprot:s75_g6.t1